MGMLTNEKIRHIFENTNNGDRHDLLTKLIEWNSKPLDSIADSIVAKNGHLTKILNIKELRIESGVDLQVAKGAIEQANVRYLRDQLRKAEGAAGPYPF